MVLDDVVILIAGFLMVLVIGGFIADHWDWLMTSRERREAKRRNRR